MFGFLKKKAAAVFPSPVTALSKRARTHPLTPLIDAFPEESFFPTLFRLARDGKSSWLQAKCDKEKKDFLVLRFTSHENLDPLYIGMNWTHGEPMMLTVKGKENPSTKALNLKIVANKRLEEKRVYLDPKACPDEQQTSAALLIDLISPYVPKEDRAAFERHVAAFRQAHFPPPTWAQRVKQFFCAPIL